MKWLMLGFATLTGVFNAVQSGSNTTLNKATAAPFWSMLVVFSVALVTSCMGILVSGQRPAPGFAAQLPWWAWIGGLFGASYVFAMVVVAKEVGAGLFMALTVTAAIVTSLTMDHFGLMGFDVHPAGVGRIAGALSIIFGLILIAKY